MSGPYHLFLDCADYPEGDLDSHLESLVGGPHEEPLCLMILGDLGQAIEAAKEEALKNQSRVVLTDYWHTNILEIWPTLMRRRPIIKA